MVAQANGMVQEQAALELERLELEVKVKSLCAKDVGSRLMGWMRLAAC